MLFNPGKIQPRRTQREEKGKQKHWNSSASAASRFSRVVLRHLRNRQDVREFTNDRAVDGSDRQHKGKKVPGLCVARAANRGIVEKAADFTLPQFRHPVRRCSSSGSLLTTPPNRRAAARLEIRRIRVVKTADANAIAAREYGDPTPGASSPS